VRAVGVLLAARAELEALSTVAEDVMHATEQVVVGLTVRVAFAVENLDASVLQQRVLAQRLLERLRV
jgi:hypothetical protein